MAAAPPPAPSQQQQYVCPRCRSGLSYIFQNNQWNGYCAQCRQFYTISASPEKVDSYAVYAAQALQLISDASVIGQRIGHSAWAATLYGELAGALTLLVERTGDMQRLQDAIKCATAITDTASRAPILHDICRAMADIGRRSGDRGKIQDAFRFAETIANEYWHSAAHGRALVAFAQFAGRSRDTRTVLEALGMAKGIKVDEHRARTLTGIAGVMVDLGMLNEAEELLRTAEEMGTKAPAGKARAEACMEAANVLAHLGKRDAALQTLMKTTGTLDAIPQEFERLSTTVTLINTLTTLGFLSEATAMAEKTLKVARSIGFDYDRIRAMALLSESIARLGKKSEAAESVREAVGAAKAIGDAYNRSRAFSEIARAMIALGMKADGLELTKDAISAAKVIPQVAPQEMFLHALALTDAARAMVELSAIPAVAKETVKELSALVQDAGAYLKPDSVQPMIKELNEALDRMDYSAFFDTALTVRKLVSRERLRFEETRAAISRPELDEFSRLGADVEPMRKMEVEARDAFEKHDYEKARTIAAGLAEAVEASRKNLRPVVHAEISTAKEFRVNEWGRLDGKLTNIGGTHARNLEIEISGPVELRGVRQVPSLSRGGEARLQIGVKPKESGSVPLEIKVRFIDLAGNAHTMESTGWVDVLGEQEVLREQFKPQQIINIGSIGEILGTGATSIRDSAVVGKALAGPGGTTAGALCPSCGESVKSNWKQCPVCGARL